MTGQRRTRTRCYDCNRSRETIEMGGDRLYGNGICSPCGQERRATKVFERCFRCQENATTIAEGGWKIHRNGYCTPCSREYNKERNSRPDVREKNLETHEAYRKRRPDLVNARARRRNQRIKREVFSHYGGRCKCCGERRLEFLSIDHIHGNGAEHRRSGIGLGLRMYYWLRRNGFPDGFRLLCMNCNTSLGKWGYCPHGNVTVGDSSTNPDANLQGSGPTGFHAEAGNLSVEHNLISAGSIHD